MHIHRCDHRDARFPVNLICINADMLPEFAGQAGAALLRRALLDRAVVLGGRAAFRTRWQGSFELLDEVWAPTAHVAAALAPVAPVPVSTVRIPVQMPESSRARGPSSACRRTFMFLFSFDYLSVFERKNPLALVDAFTRAFAPGDGAALVLKCINGERDPAIHERLLAAAGGIPTSR